MAPVKKTITRDDSGKLKIGNNWNAITIIALSQNNPLKAIAEFVENSIDAQAKNITILRGKQKSQSYIKVMDDGEGIDDFKYVATHIGDSIKRKLKKSGVTGIQGEFGIGLLSFWTVGEELTITSTGKSGQTRRMKLMKGNPGYHISGVRTLLDRVGTDLTIQPILPGVRQLSGEKIQNYLASELRDRISKTGVTIRIIDRTSRKELLVEPRKFKGRLLHLLPEVKSPLGEIYCELYLNEPSQESEIGLYKLGTRVLSAITRMDHFNEFPWNSPYLEGLIDVSFLQLTPGTRDGVIYDDAFESFAYAMVPMTKALTDIIEEQKKAEEEKASKNILHKISKAIREALHHLPQEEYSWLSVSQTKKIDVVKKEAQLAGGENSSGAEQIEPIYIASQGGEKGVGGQREFFEIPGALYSAIISPSSAIIGVGKTKRLKVVARDKSKRQLDSGYSVIWYIQEGAGVIDDPEKEFIEFTAPEEPGIIILKAIVAQDELECEAECIITVTEELVKKEHAMSGTGEGKRKGLPGYTYQKSPGELWRSRYDAEKYLIIVNNGHADFIYASKSRMRKLRYITKLFTKELVLANFPEASREQILERMIELQMYAEENLKGS